MSIRFALLGASGRMGQIIVDLLQAEFADQIVLASCPARGDDLQSVLNADVVVDFSLPAGTEALLDVMLATQQVLPVYVGGTTGLSDQQMQRLDQLADKTRVMHAKNFSLGVAAVNFLLSSAAPMFRAMDAATSIHEVHHVHKQDMPSGTALDLQQNLQSEGFDEVPVTAEREGEVIGQHQVNFALPGEQVALQHEANDRQVFARGAIEAALWLHSQSSSHGRYDMQRYIKERFFS